MNIKKLAWITVKLAVVVASWLYVARELSNSDIGRLVHPLHVSAAASFTGLLLLLLVLVNWAIEAWKWIIALADIVDLDFAGSFSSILAGTTLALISPNRVGDYIGRQLHVPGQKRQQGLAAAVACSVAQLSVTLVAGCLALPWFLPHVTAASTFVIFLTIFASIIVSIIVLILYFQAPRLVPLVRRLPFSKHIETMVVHFEGISRRQLSELLLWSAARYLVFLLQFYLAFRFFGVHVAFLQGSVAVALIYLTNAVIPSTTLMELGIRCGASVFFVGAFTRQVPEILEASLLVWIFNLALPALAGSLVLLAKKHQ